MGRFGRWLLLAGWRITSVLAAAPSARCNVCDHGAAEDGTGSFLLLRGAAAREVGLPHHDLRLARTPVTAVEGGSLNAGVHGP